MRMLAARAPAAATLAGRAAMQRIILEHCRASVAPVCRDVIPIAAKDLAIHIPGCVSSLRFD